MVSADIRHEDKTYGIAGHALHIPLVWTPSLLQSGEDAIHIAWQA
jgi:hypothetical protein